MKRRICIIGGGKGKRGVFAGIADPRGIEMKREVQTAQNILESAGFEVFNPAEQEDTGKSWTWYMRKDIAGLMECDAIFLLKDWEDSRGARLEYYIAQQLEMKIFREVEK